MDTNKNLYTIIYATILVVLVAALLAFVSSALKDRQQKNIDVEKQQSILAAVGLASEANSAPDKIAYVQGEYAKYITDSYIVNSKGEKVEGDAFKIDLKSQYDIMRQIPNVPEAQQASLKESLKLPVLVCTMDDGKKITILSCYGAGLWGPIWGYIGIGEDYNTIYGTNFSHKSETPGLGAEIATPKFSSQFKGKTIYEGSHLNSVEIVKGGADPENKHQVDAISGGTITSRALEETIRQWLGFYEPFLSKAKEIVNNSEIK